MTMTLNQHPVAIDREEVFDRKRSERIAGIDQLIASEHEHGKVLDRLLATILWDTNHAPLTTNLKQLAEIGIHPPALDALTDDEVASALTLVIDGLADLGIFLSSTDHLDNRRLYSHLFMRVIVEEVRDIPPTEEMSEFIDMSLVPSSEGGEPTLDGEGRVLKLVNRDSTLPTPKRVKRES